MNKFFTNMRILTFITMIFLVPSVCLAEKEDIGDFDGNTWATWTDLQKMSFLSGFISGSSNVITGNIAAPYYSSMYCSSEYKANKTQGLWSRLIDTNKKTKQTFSRQDICILLDEQMSNKNDELVKFGIYKISVGQLYEGLNLFYSDFKNKQINIDTAVYVVKKQIDGASPEEIEALLQWLRGGMKDFNKRFYIDKDGKKKIVFFP